MHNMDYVENTLIKRVQQKRAIQEEKINLIRKLSECETEEDLIEVMRMKEEFMANYCFDER